MNNSSKPVACRRCRNLGFYIGTNPLTGKDEHVICDFCVNDKNSIFSILRKLTDEQYQIEIALNATITSILQNTEGQRYAHG